MKIKSEKNKVNKNTKTKKTIKKKNSFFNVIINYKNIIITNLLIYIKKNIDKESYFKGIIGSIFAVMLLSLLLLLVYIYGLVLSIPLFYIFPLAVIVGYEEFKGPINKKTILIVTIISILTTVINITITIPLSFLRYEGYKIAFSNLNLIYTINKTKILKYGIISCICSIIGLGEVILSIKHQIEDK